MRPRGPEAGCGRRRRRERFRPAGEDADPLISGVDHRLICLVGAGYGPCRGRRTATDRRTSLTTRIVGASSSLPAFSQAAIVRGGPAPGRGAPDRLMAFAWMHPRNQLRFKISGWFPSDP
jgi:hypothetical protein